MEWPDEWWDFGTHLKILFFALVFGTLVVAGLEFYLVNNYTFLDFLQGYGR